MKKFKRLEEYITDKTQKEQRLKEISKESKRIMQELISNGTLERGKALAKKLGLDK